MAVQGEGMIGEDYQVYISDGPPFGQVLVLGCGDLTAGGKQKQSHLKIPSLVLYLYVIKIYIIVTETYMCSNGCSLQEEFLYGS